MSAKRESSRRCSRASPRPGRPRHRPALDRLRAQGGPARAARRQLVRGLQDRHGHLLPLLHPHGPPCGAADAGGRNVTGHDLPWGEQGRTELQSDGSGEAALESAVRYLAYELGDKHIRVHAVSPGPLKTRAASGLKDFDLLLNEASERSPIGELVDIDDVGLTTAFLTTPFARRLTARSPT